MGKKVDKRQANSVARRRDHRTETKGQSLSHGAPTLTGSADVLTRPKLAWKLTGAGWVYVVLS